MIQRIDHFVLTVASLEVTCRFYERDLLFERSEMPGKTAALRFGQQKINGHQVGHTFEPKAAWPTPGAADFCLITDRPLQEVAAHLKECDVQIELGPVARDGAEGPMQSLYFRDDSHELAGSDGRWHGRNAPGGSLARSDVEA